MNNVNKIMAKKYVSLTEKLKRTKKYLETISEHPHVRYDLWAALPTGTAEAIEDIIDQLENLIDHIEDPQSYTG